MNKILITGVGGYIGRHVLSNALIMKDLEVSVIDIKPIDTTAKCYTMDFLKEAADPDLYQRLGAPDVIIHLAWQDGFNHKSDAHLKNLPAHYQFIKNMVDSGCKSISVMGSMHEIGYHIGQVNNDTPCNPMSLYGIAKNALRQAVMTYAEGKDVSLKWLRAFYITGDDAHNNSIFAKILQMAKEGKKTFPFTDGKSRFDFEDVDELSKQIIAASLQDRISGIINVCSGKSTPLKEKVESFIKENHLNITPEYGAFPSRKYDSPEIYGNAELINQIMSETKVEYMFLNSKNVGRVLNEK